MLVWKVMHQQVTDDHVRAAVFKENADKKPDDYVITWTRTPVFVEHFCSKEDAYRRMETIKGVI